jgi:hypothetical protein
MRTQCANLTVAGTFGAPRLASFWAEYSGRIPPNGLIWGPLIPWKPVNALQSWRRLCDPNGSVRVVGSAGSREIGKIEQGAAVRQFPCAPYRPHSSTRCVVSSPLMRAKLFSWHAPVVAKSRGAPLPRCACLRLTSSAAVTRGDDRALGTPVSRLPQCAAASLRAPGALFPGRGGARSEHAVSVARRGGRRCYYIRPLRRRQLHPVQKLHQTDKLVSQS